VSELNAREREHEGAPPSRRFPGAELLTIQEVAIVLRTSASAVYALISRGRLPGVVRVGRRVLVRRATLEDFIEQGGSRTPSPSERRT
jgi:excisionase family DNA binding protein